MPQVENRTIHDANAHVLTPHDDTLQFSEVNGLVGNGYNRSLHGTPLNVAAGA